MRQPTGGIEAWESTNSARDRMPRARVLISEFGRHRVPNDRMSAHAHLAATVMMGGLLEALLLARINRMPSLAPAFQARAAPRDKVGKTFPLKEWTLKNYIDVCHELGWIGQSAKDLGAVLRDWRNYIHPEKELSHGITIEARDTETFWVVFTSLAAQVIASA